MPALELAAALQGADACKTSTGYLTSIRLRNNKPMYDGKKARLGELTLDETYARCTKMEVELKAKPAFGCGRHYVSVSQSRVSIHDRWGSVDASGKQAFEAMDCSEMPKRSVFPGASASYKSTYVSTCGADAVDGFLSATGFLSARFVVSPGAIAGWLVIVVLGSTLATLAPARRAARFTVREALAET